MWVAPRQAKEAGRAIVGGGDVHLLLHLLLHLWHLHLLTAASSVLPACAARVWEPASTVRLREGRHAATARGTTCVTVLCVTVAVCAAQVVAAAPVLEVVDGACALVIIHTPT